VGKPKVPGTTSPWSGGTALSAAGAQLLERQGFDVMTPDDVVRGHALSGLYIEHNRQMYAVANQEVDETGQALAYASGLFGGMYGGPYGLIPIAAGVLFGDGEYMDSYVQGYLLGSTIGSIGQTGWYGTAAVPTSGSQYSYPIGPEPPPTETAPYYTLEGFSEFVSGSINDYLGAPYVESPTPSPAAGQPGDTSSVIHQLDMFFFYPGLEEASRHAAQYLFELSKLQF